MNLLLVRPAPGAMANSREPVAARMGCWPPLGLQYLHAAAVRDGHDAAILDGHWQDAAPAAVAARVRAGDIGCVGITGTIPELRTVRALARAAQAAGARVAVGGGVVDWYAETLLRDGSVAYAVAGDGEPALAALLAGNGRVLQPETVPGLVWLDGGAVRRNPPAAGALDEYPLPSHALLPRERYGRPDARHPLATMVSARGCGRNCAFCARGDAYARPRFRAPEAVAGEMAQLAAQGFREVVFANDSLLTSRPQALALGAAIRQRGLRLRWQGTARVDQVTPELARELAAAGCTQLKFGVESGDPAILDRMCKGITPEQARAAFAATRAAGMKTGAYFIIGYAGETEASVARTIALARDLQPDYVMFYPGLPLPGTKFWDDAVGAGLVPPDYWERFAGEAEPPPLAPLYPAVPRWLQTAFRAVYGDPRYLLRRARDPLSWRAALRSPRLIASLLRGGRA